MAPGAPTAARMKTSLCLTIFSLCVASGHADDRIMVEGAMVNGAPVRMAFDTGADEIYFFSSAPERLHLKVSPVRNIWGQNLGPATEKCAVQFWGFSQKQRVRVLAAAPFASCDCDALDGLVGWQAVSGKVLVFDTASNTVHFVREVPKEASQWTKLPLRFWDLTLVLKVPDHARTGFIVIDTGSESGLGLPPQSWREWRAAHASQPVTLHAFFMPATEGIMVREQAWASDFKLGSLSLTDIVVEEADPVSVRSASRKHTATLGLAALKRLDLIVDGRNDVAYLRPKTTPPPPCVHNRAGAVFVPPDKESDALTARVVDGGPAYEAGIRDGDVLLKIEEHDVTNWRTATNKPSAFWKQPAGTQLALTLQRSNQTFRTTIMLRDILLPTTAITGP